MADLTADDLVFAFENKLVCRHVSDAAAYQSHLTSDANGDAFTIGAVNALLLPREKRDERTVEAALLRQHGISRRGEGPSMAELIREQAPKLIEAYKAEMRNMVDLSVNFDAVRGDPTNAHFLIYRDHPHATMPSDLPDYPFGKCGKGQLFHTCICAGIFLDDTEKEALRGNMDGIIDALTEKLLTAIPRMRARSMNGPAQGGEPPKAR